MYQVTLHLPVQLVRVFLKRESLAWLFATIIAKSSSLCAVLEAGMTCLVLQKWNGSQCVPCLSDHSWRSTTFHTRHSDRSLGILAPVKMYDAGPRRSIGSSAGQPYWECKYCVVAWELACFPANVHLKNNNFTSHEDCPWSRRGHGQKPRPNAPITQLSMYSYKYIAYLYRGDMHLWENNTMLTQESPHHPLPHPVLGHTPHATKTLSPACWTFHFLREILRGKRRHREKK